MIHADTWALLWSHSQNAFHVERVADMLASNREAYVANRPSDYVPLFIGAQDDCRKAADSSLCVLNSRENPRADKLYTGDDKDVDNSVSSAQLVDNSDCGGAA